MIRQGIVCLSPILVIAIGHIAAKLAGERSAVWWWIPVMAAYWMLLATLIVAFTDRHRRREWLQRSRGAVGWRLLSLVTIGLFVPVWVPNVHLLRASRIMWVWLLIGLINPWLEEGFWRGLVIDPPIGKRGLLLATYSTTLFAASHPLIWGVNVPALAGAPGFLGGCFTGGVWALVYCRTRSLRWPVLAHGLVDLVSLTPWIFMHQAVLPG